MKTIHAFILFCALSLGDLHAGEVRPRLFTVKIVVAPKDYNALSSIDVSPQCSLSFVDPRTSRPLKDDRHSFFPSSGFVQGTDSPPEKPVVLEFKNVPPGVYELSWHVVAQKAVTDVPDATSLPVQRFEIKKDTTIVCDIPPYFPLTITCKTDRLKKYLGKFVAVSVCDAGCGEFLDIARIQVGGASLESVFPLAVYGRKYRVVLELLDRSVKLAEYKIVIDANTMIRGSVTFSAETKKTQQ